MYYAADKQSVSDMRSPSAVASMWLSVCTICECNACVAAASASVVSLSLTACRTSAVACIGHNHDLHKCHGGQQEDSNKQKPRYLQVLV